MAASEPRIANKARRHALPANAQPLTVMLSLQYRLGRKIGSGSFGDIYLGMDSLLSLLCARALRCGAQACTYRRVKKWASSWCGRAILEVRA
jgi:hypothetical protein